MGIYGLFNKESIVEFLEFLTAFLDFLVSKYMPDIIVKISLVQLLEDKLEQNWLNYESKQEHLNIDK